jgi:tripartite ATP-independent transporter DctM subunit
MIFAGMSGAAVADAAGIGRVEIKAMNEQGFDNEFSAAVTAASSTIGPIIPPSIPMVIFGMVANVSIPALFIGGILPGILMGISMMVVVYIVSVRRHYPRSDRFSMRLVKTTFLKALPSLMTPVILIGGILGGVFTPTEAAAVAVVYALFLGCLIYRDIPIAELGEIIFRTSISTAIILIIISTAAVIGLFVAREQVPQKLVVSLSSISKNPIIILLSINIMLLFLGCFLDTTAIIVILTPILLPVIKMFGIDPVHFGVLMILNLMIGLLTPPFGLIMFVICDICKISVFQFTKATLPFIIILLVTLFLVTYIPEIVLFLPRLLIK